MSPFHSPAVRRLGLVGSVAVAAHLVGGCYTAVPVTTDARPIGSQVVVDITDLGRVHLGSQLGPSPLHLEGRLTAATDTSYTLAVTRVEGLRGESTTWAGEEVTVSRADVGLVRLRRLDRTRTTLAALIGAGVVALAALAVSLVVKGGDSGEVTKPGEGGNGT